MVKVDFMRFQIIFRKWNNNHVIRKMVKKRRKKDSPSIKINKNRSNLIFNEAQKRLGNLIGYNYISYALDATFHSIFLLFKTNPGEKAILIVLQTNHSPLSIHLTIYKLIRKTIQSNNDN